MELHIAIKKAISDFGNKIIVDKRFINILSDYQAFDDIYDVKEVLIKAQNENFLHEIYGKSKKSIFSRLFGNTNNNIEDYEDIKLSFRHFFRKQEQDISIPMYVLECIFYGLGIVNSVSSAKAQCKRQTRDNNKFSNKIYKNSIANAPKNLNGNTQFVVLRVLPKDSNMFIDGRKTTLQNGIFAQELQEGKYVIAITHSSGLYHDMKYIVQVKAEVKIDKTITLPLKNPPINITIKVKDKFAILYIDGNIINGSFWQGSLLVGKHVIIIKKTGYRDVIHNLIIGDKDNNKTIELAAPNEPICGTLRVTSQEIGIPIALDNKQVGCTPIILHNVLVGKHTITLFRPGHIDNAKIILNDGEILDIDDNFFLNSKPNLNRSQKTQTIRTKIRSQEPCTYIYVDDNLVGMNTWDGYLSPGVHCIKHVLSIKKIEKTASYLISPQTASIVLPKLSKR